jgi:hypothetical protein
VVTVKFEITVLVKRATPAVCMLLVDSAATDPKFSEAGEALTVCACALIVVNKAERQSVIARKERRRLTRAFSMADQSLSVSLSRL